MGYGYYATHDIGWWAPMEWSPCSLRARICALPTADDIAHGSCLACSSLVWLVVMSSHPSRRRSLEEAFTTPAASRSQRRRQVVTAQPSTRRSSRGTASRTRNRNTSRRRSQNAPFVSPPSSIRDTARDPARGSGSRSNLFYEPSYRHSQESQGSHLFSPQQQQQQQQSNQDAPAPRLCYCDQPIDPDCVECAANRFCMQHPGFYCTGPCGWWIHPKCAGYEFHAGPDGGEEGAFLRSTFYYPNNMIIPISSASQGEQHPLYCIKCWEHQKQVQAKDTVLPAFGSLSREEKVLR